MAQIKVVEQQEKTFEIEPGSSRIWLVSGPLESVICIDKEILEYGVYYLGMVGMRISTDDGSIFIPDDNISHIERLDK